MSPQSTSLTILQPSPHRTLPKSIETVELVPHTTLNANVRSLTNGLCGGCHRSQSGEGAIRLADADGYLIPREMDAAEDADDD